ncbi:MAG: hypothetical protein PWP35_1300 [Bacteroidales bacterium]|nr:hypothetical protein [Bacteroidales bacterium]
MRLNYLFLALVMAIPFGLEAQSPKAQRLVLLEEFTSSTCGPCAAANPTIISRLQQNPDKFTAIFYHVGWPSPGNDPMYLHNTQESNARVSYYSVNSVPHSVLDGNFYSGHPNGWSMTTINNRLAVPSPCEIDLQHYLNAAQDSIFLNMLIKPTTVMSGSQLVAHNVVIEKHIHFNTPPGTNGEKDFYNVMKKMLPGSGGTSLPSSLDVGDYVIIQTAWKLANVYDINELAAVGFIQNNVTKEVFQTTNSSTNPVTPLYANDAQILGISNVTPENCSGTVSPIITVRNNGSNNLTQLKVKYRVDNNPEQEYVWTGNLGLLNRTKVALPTYSFTPQYPGILKIYVSLVNGVQDEYRKNDTLTFTLSQPQVATPTVYLWIKTDNKPEDITWEIVDALDGTIAGSGGPYTQANTMIKETISLQEGRCYHFGIYDASGDGLCCANGLGFFTFFYGNNQVIAEGTNFGSEVLAQFNTQSGVGVDENQAMQFRVYPNPCNQQVMVSFNSTEAGKALFRLTDVSGQNVLKSVLIVENAGINHFEFDLKDLTSGWYLAEIVLPDGQTFRSPIIRK